VLDLSPCCLLLGRQLAKTQITGDFAHATG